MEPTQVFPKGHLIELHKDLNLQEDEQIVITALPYDFNIMFRLFCLEHEMDPADVIVSAVQKFMAEHVMSNNSLDCLVGLTFHRDKDEE